MKREGAIVILYISSDMVAILEHTDLNDTAIDERDILLEGNDLDGGIIHCPANIALEIVDKCFVAREKGIEIGFSFKGKPVHFK